MWWANLTSFVPVLVLIMCIIHRSMLYFAVAVVYKSNTLEKTLQLESVEQLEQYHIKFVETSHYLKWHGRKAFVESFFCGHNLHCRVTVTCTLLPEETFFRCVRARTHLHALMTQTPCAVGMRNAILRNHLKHQDIEIKWVATGKEWVAMGTEIFVAVGVFPIQLLGCQVSMVCAAKWPR